VTHVGQHPNVAQASFVERSQPACLGVTSRLPSARYVHVQRTVKDRSSVLPSAMVAVGAVPALEPPHARFRDTIHGLTQLP
jgi:hypothetical protein